MTARRVIVTQERIIQTDDANELKCGERCQFIRSVLGCDICELDENSHRKIIDRNRTEACTSGNVRAMGGGQ